jgi:plasmid stabilization system protein ParE
MAYTIAIARRAERDLVGLYREINADDSAVALEWYRGLKAAILTLREHPNRCPVIRKRGALRQLLYGEPHVYRVIFRVVEKQKRVEVLHIRHGARRKFKASDLA